MTVNISKNNGLQWLRKSFILKTTLLLTILFSLLIPFQASAASGTIYSVGQGQSIQTSINAMSSGDTLEIDPGTYNEALTITKENLTITNKPGTTGEVIINANRSSYGIYIKNTSNVTIRGLTVTNVGRDPIHIDNGADNKVLNCKLTEYGMDSDSSAGSGGVYQNGGSNLIIDGCTIIPGKSRPLANYYDNYNTCVFINGTSGGHKITNSFMEGAWDKGGDYKSSIIDTIGTIQTYNDTDFNNSLIDGNTMIGAWDDLIEVDGQCANLTISNNWLEARGARSIISITPCDVGPLYVKNNVMLDWIELAVKTGILLGENAAPKYFEGNILWSAGDASIHGWGEYAGIGTSNDGTPITNSYLTNNKIHSRNPLLLTNRGAVKECKGNTFSSANCQPSDILSSYPDNTIADFARPTR